MLKHTHFELGGKDAFVIAEDADPEHAARAVAYAGLINAGQVCTSTECVYLPKNIARQFTDCLELILNMWAPPFTPTLSADGQGGVHI